MIATIICLSNPDVLPVACEVGHAHLPQDRNDRLNRQCRMALHLLSLGMEVSHIRSFQIMEF